MIKITHTICCPSLSDLSGHHADYPFKRRVWDSSQWVHFDSPGSEGIDLSTEACLEYIVLLLILILGRRKLRIIENTTYVVFKFHTEIRKQAK